MFRIWTNPQKRNRIPKLVLCIFVGIYFHVTDYKIGEGESFWKTNVGAWLGFKGIPCIGSSCQPVEVCLSPSPLLKASLPSTRWMKRPGTHCLPQTSCSLCKISGISGFLTPKQLQKRFTPQTSRCVLQGAEGHYGVMIKNGQTQVVLCRVIICCMDLEITIVCGLLKLLCNICKLETLRNVETKITINTFGKIIIFFHCTSIYALNRISQSERRIAEKSQKKRRRKLTS